MCLYNGENQLIGVIGIDVTLTEISDNVAATQLADGGYSFLIDETGSAITLPDQGYKDILHREKKQDELGTDLTGAADPFRKIVNQMISGETGFESVRIDGVEYFCCRDAYRSSLFCFNGLIMSCSMYV